MKKLNITILSLAAVGCFFLANTAPAKAATSTDCSTLGYVNTTSQCSGKAILKCPFDNSKIYCGITACDLRTAASCGSLGCKTYWSDCSSKCQTCNPADTCTPSYNMLYVNYRNILKKAVGCNPYVSWNGGKFPIKVDDTCETFKARLIEEVKEHNLACPNKLLPTSGQYHPSSIQCSSCAINNTTNIAHACDLSFCLYEDDDLF